MPSFKEWLAQETEKEGSPARRKQTVEEWTGAIAALFKRIVEWLAEDDVEQVLNLGWSTVRRAEEGLGTYEIQALEISLPARSVRIVPVARNVAGGVLQEIGREGRASGRVDMTNGGDKYMLYRHESPGGPRWVIVDDEMRAVQDLGKETFERALQDLLS